MKNLTLLAVAALLLLAACDSMDAGEADALIVVEAFLYAGAIAAIPGGHARTGHNVLACRRHRAGPIRVRL